MSNTVALAITTLPCPHCAQSTSTRGRVTAEDFVEEGQAIYVSMARQVKQYIYECPACKELFQSQTLLEVTYGTAQE